MKQHTNQEIMEYFDIKPGDRFEYEGEVYTAESLINFTYYLNCQDGKSLAFTTCEEVQEKIKALPRVMRFGDKFCGSIYCIDCPLYNLSCPSSDVKNTISKVYHDWVKKSGYRIPKLEAKLDEEVEVEE